MWRRDRERSFDEQLEHERERAKESVEPDEIRREPDMMRLRGHRLCGKYGLKGRRERE